LREGKTANCRLLPWLLKTQEFGRFQERLSAADFGGDSLKKSPKYFLLNSGATGRLTPEKQRAMPVQKHRHGANQSRLDWRQHG
jgi:hypothetical protein